MLTTNDPRIVINNTNNTGDNRPKGWLANFLLGTEKDDKLPVNRD